MNEKVFERVKNPYLKLFYIVMVEISAKRKPHEKHPLDKFDQAINLFDFVAVCCKYLDQDKLKEVLDHRIESDIAKGNLQVFALIGLKSQKGPKVI